MRDEGVLPVDFLEAEQQCVHEAREEGLCIKPKVESCNRRQLPLLLRYLEDSRTETEDQIKIITKRLEEEWAVSPLLFDSIQVEYQQFLELLQQRTTLQKQQLRTSNPTILDLETKVQEQLDHLELQMNKQIAGLGELKFNGRMSSVAQVFDRLYKRAIAVSKTIESHRVMFAYNYPQPSDHTELAIAHNYLGPAHEERYTPYLNHNGHRDKVAALYRALDLHSKTENIEPVMHILNGSPESRADIEAALALEYLVMLSTISALQLTQRRRASE